MAEQAELLHEAIALTKTKETHKVETNESNMNKTEEEKYSLEVLRKVSKTQTTKEISKKESITVSSICDINNTSWRTPGDRELRKIIHFDGLEETLYFTPNKYHHKKLFVSFTIDNVAVDSMNETFRMKFYLQFNWIPTETDYKSLYKAAVLSQKQNEPQLLSEWHPEWYPHLEFENVKKIHDMQWRPHPLIPEKGPFRLAQYKKWGNDRNTEINAMYREYDFEHIKWFCAELECDITFKEELEIQSFPFDVQDLSVCFRITSKHTINYTVFSLPNYFNADATTISDTKQEKKLKHPSLVGSIDSGCSQLDEWDVENCLIEFTFSKIIISLKLARRWKPVVINTLLIIFLVSILSFTVFTVDFEDTASRLELTMTLILTAVLFDIKSSPKPYLTYLDKYILTSYGYLTFVMIENALCGYFDQDLDNILFSILLLLFIIQHIVFIGYAFTVRNREKKKIFMGYEEVKKYNKEHEIEREKFFLYETNVKQHGLNKYRKYLAISGAQCNT